MQFTEGVVVRNEKPPIYNAVLTTFGLTDTDVLQLIIIFAYKGEIWNPTGAPITRDRIVHEMVHFQQQGEDSDEWWSLYLTDPAFRLGMEIEAYRAQYKWAKKNIRDRNMVARLLVFISTAFSSKMYGNLMTYAEAKKAISS